MVKNVTWTNVTIPELTFGKLESMDILVYPTLSAYRNSLRKFIAKDTLEVISLLSRLKQKRASELARKKEGCK